MSIKAYLKLMRLHKPLPILLCLWPTLWGLWLAGGGFPGFRLCTIFIVGVILMRSAGCVFNDLADRKFDGRVERTKSRPLVTEEVSAKGALILGLILVAIAFGLVCLTNYFTIELSFVALALALIYPWMKRITHFPQIVLGLAFNFGLLMAFSAVQNHLPLIAWPWYGSAVLWTLIYDSYYALADQKEDKKIGLYSTAVFWGDSSLIWIRILQACLILLWGVLLFHSLSLKLIIIFLLLLLSFYRQNQFAREEHYLTAFLDNHWVGFLVFMGIIVMKGT